MSSLAPWVYWLAGSYCVIKWCQAKSDPTYFHARRRPESDPMRSKFMRFIPADTDPI